MASSTVRIRGLRELDRALGRYAKDLKKELRSELRQAAEPVRGRAEELAGSSIRNVGSVWGSMRVGVTTKGAYVAPGARRRGGSPRPNFGTLLMERAMLPALEDKQGEVIERVDDLLDRLGNRAGF